MARGAETVTHSCCIFYLGSHRPPRQGSRSHRSQHKHPLYSLPIVLLKKRIQGRQTRKALSASFALGAPQGPVAHNLVVCSALRTIVTHSFAPAQHRSPLCRVTPRDVHLCSHIFHMHLGHKPVPGAASAEPLVRLCHQSPACSSAVRYTALQPRVLNGSRGQGTATALEIAALCGPAPPLLCSLMAAGVL